MRCNLFNLDDNIDRTDDEKLVFNSLFDFVKTTNEIYGECVAKSIRNSIDDYDYVRGFYNFRYWIHNGTKLKEPTFIEFNKTEADEDFGPVIQLIKDEENGISHLNDEPVNFIEEFDKVIKEEDERMAKLGITFDDVYDYSKEENLESKIIKHNDCNCKK